MSAFSRPRTFWVTWLQVASGGVVLFGLFLVLWPALARQGFSLLIYASTNTIDTFGQEQIRYVSLAHAVLGGVMIGWGACLYLITREMLAEGSGLAWNLIAISMCAWFVPDTAYSLLSGYWPNAVLNCAILILFAIPLLGIRRCSGE